MTSGIDPKRVARKETWPDLTPDSIREFVKDQDFAAGFQLPGRLHSRCPSSC